MKQRKLINDLTQNSKKLKKIENLLKEQFGKKAFHKTVRYKWSNYIKLGFDFKNEKDLLGLYQKNNFVPGYRRY